MSRRQIAYPCFEQGLPRFFKEKLIQAVTCADIYKYLSSETIQRLRFQSSEKISQKVTDFHAGLTDEFDPQSVMKFCLLTHPRALNLNRFA